jgi:hypothetical protein
MPMPEAPSMYSIVVFRPFPTAPLDVRGMYIAVAPRPIPAAEASRWCRHRFQLRLG